MYEKQLVIICNIINLIQNIIKSSKIMESKYDITTMIYSINIVLQSAYDKIEKLYFNYILKPELKKICYNTSKKSFAESK